jgi:hypothetical protein
MKHSKSPGGSRPPLAWRTCERKIFPTTKEQKEFVKQPASSPGQENDRTASRKLQSLKLTVRRTNQIAKEQKLVKCFA